MDELHASWTTGLDSTPVEEASASLRAIAERPPLEFVGSSDHTIGEAVRRALSNVALSLQTLEGVGVMVIPQIDRAGAQPRFHVTLRVSPQVAQPADASS